MPTPADQLREAAQLMRDRANAATPGPWRADESEIYSDDTDWVGETLQDGDWDITRANSAHIAGWDPTVALAVADWLEFVVGMLAVAPAGILGTQLDHALAVARAYLGTTEQVGA